jgi:DNA-binding MarR family transcriptional regulator
MSDGHRDHAKRAWGLLFDLLDQERRVIRDIAEAFDLTAPQLFLLRSIEPDHRRGMGELAVDRSCDRSNVTRMVDRLVQRGLLERREGAHDRRVKTLILTPEGVALRARLIDRMSQPPLAIEMLCPADQADLARILELALVNARATQEAALEAEITLSG